MFVLGSMREIIGNGTLFDGADSLLGSWAKVLRVEVFHTDTPFLLAMLPPGAFIGLGMMLAVKYLIDERSKQRKAKAVQAAIVAPSDVTGKAGVVALDPGKVAVNATPEAARVMLEAIKECGKPVGFKAAGGIRTVTEAAQYLALADEIMGAGWATPATFRFGASSLLGDVLCALGIDTSATAGAY